MDNKRKLNVVISWMARILSIASVGLLLLFLVGEWSEPARFKSIELVEFLFFPVGICIGMIVAWRSEGLGGVISVASLLVFYSINFAVAGSFPKGWAFAAFTAPAVLFLISWMEGRRTGRNLTARSG